MDGRINEVKFNMNLGLWLSSQNFYVGMLGAQLVSSKRQLISTGGGRRKTTKRAAEALLPDRRLQDRPGPDHHTHPVGNGEDGPVLFLLMRL